MIQESNASTARPPSLLVAWCRRCLNLFRLAAVYQRRFGSISPFRYENQTLLRCQFFPDTTRRIFLDLRFTCHQVRNSQAVDTAPRMLNFPDT